MKDTVETAVKTGMETALKTGMGTAMDKPLLNQALFEKAATLYQENGSLQRTADALGVAYAKVRKILITMGAYDTPLTRSINVMRQAGKDPSEIAQVLGMSLKRVNAFLPYEKGVYGEETPSTDAKRSRLYRKRMEVAGRRQVLRTKENQEVKETQGEVTIRGKTKTQGRTSAQEARNCAPFTPSPSVQSPKDEVAGEIHPVHLHLELKGSWLDDDQKHVLWQYADATREGVLTRDILIPSDMPLHHLHYAIQRLYGWQNSHLRAFRLDEADQQRLVGGMFQSWIALAGIIYQGLDTDGSFWDDMYRGGSFRNWLKSKYVGPYRFAGLCEEYEYIQGQIGALCQRYPKLERKAEDGVGIKKNKAQPADADFSRTVRKKVPIMDLTIREVEQSIAFDKGFDELLEKLEVASVLAGKDTALADNIALVEHFHAKEKHRSSGMGVGSRVIRALPVTRKLFYNYDYGDNWTVEITRGGLEDVCEATGVTESALRKASQTVFSEHRPVCIAKRGAQLMDDVGGMHGYASFMTVINRRSIGQEREELLEWAKGLGWSGRGVSLANMV